MNRLSVERRARIVRLLVDGTSMRAVTRLEGVSLNTTAKLVMELGAVCRAFHEERVRNVEAHWIECDEIWSFVQAKRRNAAESSYEHAGDAWTFTAVDADSRFFLQWTTGRRDMHTALRFAEGLRTRVAGAPAIHTDGMAAYRDAIPEAFGRDTNLGVMVKPERGDFSPIRRETVMGRAGVPQTSYVERSNLSIRMENRRFARLTNAHSKRIEKHEAMLDLYFTHFNWVRVHSSLRVTPAMELGLTDRLLDAEWLVQLAS